jgi:ATP-dependent protease ClpP protease subunit
MKHSVLHDVRGRVISLRDEVTPEGVDLAVDLLLRLDTRRKSSIILYLGCYGGTSSEAVKLADVLSIIKSPVISVGLGLIHGVGAWGLLLSRTRTMFPSAVLSLNHLWVPPQIGIERRMGLGSTNEGSDLHELNKSRLMTVLKKRNQNAIELVQTSEANPKFYTASEAHGLGLISGVLGIKRQDRK